jgi:hypothetical protein
MNPNDLLAQQQAILNQAMQNQQSELWALVVFQTIFLIIVGWVIYMFYARLRDIAQELQTLRISYQFANNREEQRHKRQQDSKTPNADNPFVLGA